jgi:hypothetical protein
MFLAAQCSAGEPPFSHITRGPSVSPYVRMDWELPPARNTETVPRPEGFGDANASSHRRARPVMPHTEGIRPTGHPTHFMIFDFRSS